jgi:hypothetical protein
MSSVFLAGALLVVTSLAPAGVFAQTPGEKPARADLSSFESLPERVTLGQTVFVEDQSKHQTQGRLLRLSDTSVTLRVNGNEREFTRGEIRKLARKGDSVSNGATIGGGIMGGLGLMVAISASSYEDIGAGGTLSIIGMTTAMGAGAGALIDYAIRGKTTVYRANSKTVTASLR